LSVEALASYDPNDKVGTHGAGAQQFISGSAPLAYAVYFANKDTATAPAQQVSIIDQLDISNDNLVTLSLGPVAVGNQLISPPPLLTDFTDTVDLRPTSNLLVAVHGNLDSTTGLLTWNFQSLDPSTNLPPVDPMAGFLPPGAEGSVFFSVAPKPGLATNAQISNQATIVFDTNAPINTPTWMNTIDSTPPTSHVIALPAFENSLAFAVQWAGADIGAGIQDFTVYVSDNGGPFAPFQTNTAATSATFSGQAGHTYTFYSIARDLVGNVEAPKTVAEAATQTGLDFASLTATAEINTGSHPGFELKGTLTLGPGSTGIAPDTQPVTFVLGSFSTVIPAGSFRKNRRGVFTFEGSINGVRLEFTIAPAGGTTYTFRVDANGANLSGIASPTMLELLIGGNGGVTQVKTAND
jgi:hypothetical protein